MTAPWTAAEAAADLVAVDEALAAMAAAGPEERLARIARHFAARYGEERGRQVLGSFVRLCLYLDHHAADLRARGLLDESGRTVDRAFLEALLGALDEGGAGATVAAVPARDVPDDAVEP